MPVDINGYALANVGGLKFGASNTLIDPANYGIRDPMLPGMNGSNTTGGAYKAYPYQVNSLDLNIGGVWSASTFKFTCPVAGIYYTSFGGICGNGTATGSAAYYGLVVNGALWYFSYRDLNNTWELHHIEMMVKVAAGDTISWAMNVAPAPDSGGNGGAYTSNHNICTIWLVG